MVTLVVDFRVVPIVPVLVISTLACLHLPDVSSIQHDEPLLTYNEDDGRRLSQRSMFPWSHDSDQWC